MVFSLKNGSHFLSFLCWVILDSILNVVSMKGISIKARPAHILVASNSFCTPARMIIRHRLASVPMKLFLEYIHTDFRCLLVQFISCWGCVCCWQGPTCRCVGCGCLYLEAAVVKHSSILCSQCPVFCMDRACEKQWRWRSFAGNNCFCWWRSAGPSTPQDTVFTWQLGVVCQAATHELKSPLHSVVE